MSGKKKCHTCGKKVPVAKKLCDCGHVFLNVKKCYKCGHNVPIAKKICDCSYVFKQRKKPGFQEIPVVLTSDRLRPTRPIRMKRPLYNDSDYIYNVSIAALPKQRRCDGKMYSNGQLSNKVSSVMYEHDDMYDKDLNDAALESIANTIITNSKSNDKNKVEKLYPKRERNKLTKYDCNSSVNKKTQPANKVKENLKNNIKEEKDDCPSEDVQTPSSENTKNISDTNVTTPQINLSSSNGKKIKVPTVKILPLDNGLKDLIRGEVSKAIKKKGLKSNSSGGSGSSTPSEFSDEHSVKDSDEKIEIKQELSLHIKSEEMVDMCEKSKKNETESKEALQSSEKHFVEQSDDLCQIGAERNTNISNDKKTLNEQKYSDKNELSHITKQHEKIEDISVKKKGGRLRTHLIRTNKSTNHSHQNAFVVDKYKKKQVGTIPMNNNDNVDSLKRESTDVDNETSTSDTDISTLITVEQKVKHSPLLDKKGMKRGRPKGCKDSKPRKIRHDYIERLIARKEDVDGLLNGKTLKNISKKGSCLLSKPSMMAAAKENHIQNEVLDAEEIERIERRLDKTNPFIIPDNKKELYSKILDEINRRISSQSFQSSSSL